MKSVQEILEKIDELIIREKAGYHEARGLAGMNSPGANQFMGALQSLREMRDFITEDE